MIYCIYRICMQTLLCANNSAIFNTKETVKLDSFWRYNAFEQFLLVLYIPLFTVNQNTD